MSPTPEQIRQALINTMQQPRNDASLIYEALKREHANKTPAVTGAEVSLGRKIQGMPV